MSAGEVTGTGAPGLRALVDGASRVLAEAGVGSPRVDAVALAAHALGVERLELALPPALPDDFPARYASLVDRRCRREPLQHIVGTAPFRYLTLEVRPGVFVPRPETEVVAQVAVDEARGAADDALAPLVVDLCCGAGGIALAVATEVPQATVVAVDLAPEAVALTRDNAARVGARLRVEHGDVGDPGLLGDLVGRVDVVVSNPPYIPPDAEPVDPEVRDHDPDLALYGGGTDGLDAPRAVLDAAVRLLRPGGLLVVEHAEVQDAALREEAAARGFTAVGTRPDLSGRPRMLVARRPADAATAPAAPTTRPGVEDSQP